MRRFPPTQRDDSNEEAGAPPERAERASGVGPAEARSSGVFARSERRRGDRASLPEATAAPSPAQGPCRTFNDIYVRYSDEVWTNLRDRGISDSDAKDIFQKTFVAMHRWTRGHEVVEDVARLLFTMMAHEIISHHRERERRARRFDSEADTDEQPSSKPDPEQLCARSDVRREVEGIIGRMPDDAGEVFRQVELNGVPQEQVAEMLKIPEGTMRVRLHRARRKFEELASHLLNPKPRGSK